MGYYFDASDLACYISQKFYEKYECEISSIKLQKSLYFLFAYWGGFVNKGCNNFREDRECQEMNKYHKYLFNDKIEAWTYGPVVPEIYKKFNSGIYRHSDDFSLSESINKINQEPEVKAFIDDMLDDLFKFSDFKLVDIAHQDECWKKCYNSEEGFHNTEILKDQIIDEYSRRI